MITLTLILLVVAFVAFIMAAFKIAPSNYVDMVSLGLALWVLSILIGYIK